MSKIISRAAVIATVAGCLVLGHDRAEARVEAGMLICEVGGGVALIFSSPRDLHCVFHKANGQTEAYGGRLREFGLDIGVSGRGVIAWEVIASTTELPPGELAGHYGGVEAGAAVVVGGSGRVLVGGADRRLSLQPLSVEGRAGVNLAVGVSSMELYPLFRVSHSEQRVPVPSVGLDHDMVPYHQKTPHYTCGSYTHLQRGQTLYGVAHACGVTLEALLDANPEITNVRDISAGALIHIPAHIGLYGESPCGDRAVLNEGEGLDHLAWRCGITLHALLQANPHVRDTGMVEAGLVLAIPERGEAPGQPPVQYGRTDADLPESTVAVSTRPTVRVENRTDRQVGDRRRDIDRARRLARLEIACEDETASKYGLDTGDVAARSIEPVGRGTLSVHLDANGRDTVCLISRGGEVQFVGYESEVAGQNQSARSSSGGDTGIRRERVQFASGANSAHLEGTIRGQEIVDYRLRVREGDYLNISMATDNTANYFNLMEPGETAVAIFNGSNDGNQFEGTANEDGDYTVRVYLFRNAARRNETANYRLEIIAGEGTAPSGSRAGGASANGIADIEWHPLTIGGGGVPDGAAAVIRFQQDGTIAGNTGCNRFTGTYSLEGSRIDIGPLATTRMACPDMAMELEDRILASLDSVDTFDRSGATLTLRDASGTVVASLTASGAQVRDNAMPNKERPVGGVMPDGSDFSATGQIRCVRDRDAADEMCDFGVVREGNGNGSITVFWPDGGSRVIYFENGTPVRFDQSGADGDVEMTATRDGDTNIVFVGESRFEIPDAAIFGG